MLLGVVVTASVKMPAASQVAISAAGSGNRSMWQWKSNALTDIFCPMPAPLPARHAIDLHDAPRKYAGILRDIGSRVIAQWSRGRAQVQGAWRDGAPSSGRREHVRPRRSRRRAAGGRWKESHADPRPVAGYRPRTTSTASWRETSVRPISYRAVSPSPSTSRGPRPSRLAAGEGAWRLERVGPRVRRTHPPTLGRTPG
jgi:hypothetical protein